MPNTPPPISALPAAPAHLLDAHGLPHYGQYQGAPVTLDWQGWASPKSAWWKRLHKKNWHYFALITDEIVAGIALVDVGWISTAFAYVFERAPARLLFDRARDGLPGWHRLNAQISRTPLTQALSLGRFPGLSLRAEHDATRAGMQLDLHAGPLHLDAWLDIGTRTPLLLAVGDVAPGMPHATLKSSALPLSGQLRVGARRFVLDGGVASFDYSHGFLERETAWYWASAHTTELGFNLQEGYFGDRENALWLDGQLYPLGKAHFHFNRSAPLSPWHIRTEDGLLDLRFTPAGMRSANKQLGFAASRYLQPIGQFDGWVRPHAGADKRTVRSLTGVTEDHFSRW